MDPTAQAALHAIVEETMAKMSAEEIRTLIMGPWEELRG